MLRLFSLEGRINRKKYLVNIIYIALIIVGMLIVATIVSLIVKAYTIWILYITFVLFLYLCFANAAKRFHDMHKSKWLGVLFILGIQLQLMVGDLSIQLSLQNIFRLPSIVGIIFSLVSLVVGVLLLFKKGDIGPNKYGADPLAATSIIPAVSVTTPIQQTQTPAPEPTKIV